MTSVPIRATLVPPISESRALRLGMVFLLYIAQGVPLGIFFLALPAWMAGNGVEAAGVGAVLSAVSLPWTLKFVNGFIMERYPYLPMGRRRAWLIGAQLLIMAGLLGMAFANPAAGDIALLSAFAFAINTATTFQDVAIDGMAVDLVPEEERAHANGLMFGGQALGMAASGAAAGFGFASIGLAGVMAVAALFVGMLLLALLLCRERPGERLLPWTAGAPSVCSVEAHLGAWIPVLKTTSKVMLAPTSLVALPALVMIGMHGGFYAGNLPLVAVNAADWPQERISGLLATASLLAGLLALALYGIVVGWLGPKRSLMLGFGLVAATTLLALALVGQWPQGWPIGGLMLASDPINFFMAVAAGTLAMRLCTPAVAATQFTLYMATINLGRTIGAALLGPVDGLGGDVAMIAVMAPVGLAGLLLARRLKG
jgi:PAT family beta-lactamase induction signal transducer AmpG